MPYRTFLTLVPAALLTLASAPALADDPPPPAPRAAAPQAVFPGPYGAAPAYGGFRYPGYALEPASEGTKGSRWYGWQTLVGLVPSQLMFFAGSISNSNYYLTIIGAIGHVATAPVVHWVHGNVGRGFLSLGLNVALPYVGLLAAFSSSDNASVGVGLAIAGVVAWPALDIALLHYDEPDTAKAPKDTAGFDLQSFGILPMIDRDKKGFSLVGRF